MNVGIERYEVQPFHGERSDTFGVMAFSANDIPLGIDAHWHRRQDAEMALRHYQGNLAAHGRTTEYEHRQIEARRHAPGATDAS